MNTQQLAEQTAAEVSELKWSFGFTEKQLTPVIRKALDQVREQTIKESEEWISRKAGSFTWVSWSQEEYGYENKKALTDYRKAMEE